MRNQKDNLKKYTIFAEKCNNILTNGGFTTILDSLRLHLIRRWEMSIEMAI